MLKIIIKTISLRKRALIKQPLFSLSIIVIIAIALFFRTFNYTDRVRLNADHSRDVIIGKYAAKNFLIPQIGQFSSAGPFFYGPWQYWYLELVSFLPFGLLTPWIGSTLIDLVFVFLIYFLGREVGGRKVGLLSSLFAAISPSEIGNSLVVWNSFTVPILVLLSLLVFVKFINSKKELYIFLLSFIIFLAWSIHFQNILIFPTILIALFCVKPGYKLLRCIGLVVAGGVLALLPLIYFDLRFGWHNFTSIVIYLLIDQNRIWYPNRWLTYVFDYWPSAWGATIGGNKLIGFVIISLVGVFSLLNFKNYKKNISYSCLTILFFVEFLIFRFFRGERVPYLSLFANPLIFVFSAFVCVYLFKYSRVLGAVLTLLIITFTLTYSFRELGYRESDTILSKKIVTEVLAAFPDKNIDLYSCSTELASVSYPVALILLDRGVEPEGQRIGICGGGWTSLDGKGEEDTNFTWYRKNAEDIYVDTVEWWKTNPPTSGGRSFFEFMREKLSPKCYPNC